MTTTTPIGELTGDYVFDSARTRVGFVAKAMLVTKVRGQFDEFEGSAHLDGGDPSKSTAQFSIRARSIQTRNQKRDDHLRSGDFLDVDNHPALTFTSTRVRQVHQAGFQVTGDLTIRGVTKPVTVDFELTGAENDPQGSAHVRFAGSTTINRNDWAVSGGKGMVGPKVTLEIEVVAVRQP
ncbi:YceI family protein [Streptomyces sp. NPDC012510]|uniref:YceI family protein n=1 Tax=Streptomyces sp. NPDC012510 TaxID=3364838 RepID=UPI0036E8D9F2